MFEKEIDRQKFSTFIEINNLINSDFSDNEALLTRILDSATRLTEGEASSLLLKNPENEKLYFEIALGSKGPDVKKYSLNLGEGIAGWVAQQNRSLIVNDVESDSRFFSDISKNVGFPTHSILAVPMRMSGSCIGVIEIINKAGGGKFTNEDLQWLEIFSNQAALAIRNARAFEQVKNEVRELRDTVQDKNDRHSIIGTSPVFQEKIQLARKVANTESAALITGESGVGKELFAEEIHFNSGRSNGPFIRVNCAAIPGDLVESELFGHVKGAFTDADSDRRGRFELADGGTIFLDEIAELPLDTQAKLLRVLEMKTIERLGSGMPQRVDIRILAATNKDLESMVAEGRFRKDLYYRLNILPLYVPPLRERPEDIPELADFFLQRFKRETNKPIEGFSQEAMDQLLSYSWPGNVRELENAVERAVVFCKGTVIQASDLILTNAMSADDETYQNKTLKEATHLFKKHYIQRALELNGWNQTKTAQSLGIQRTYLSRLIHDLGIEK
ncbi:MAG: sigma 54-interacting transcriptional regulator [Spirochaetales bacterium]|nr:sigma 54-interacting transcriptional regulator [Spirochaetales bacterium]